MRRLLPLACSLVLLSAAGCKKDELQEALDKCNVDLGATRTELDAQKAENERLRGENQTLNERIATLDAELSGLNAQINDLARQAGSTAAELAELREEKRKREAELEVYRKLIRDLQALVNTGKIKIAFRKGRMVVQMAQSILFDSGKDELKPEGEAALAELAKALAGAGQRDFLVGGHTDNIPIKSKRFKSNWELSTSRAISVVETLTANGMKPTNIGAAGYSEYDPVESNDSETGRASNRRIEIILMPNLGEIPGMKELLMGKGS